MRWTKDANGRVLPLNSAAWRKLRKQVLAEEPLCRHCAAQGLTVPATEVDHMRGAADNSRDALQALCKPCHSIKTMAELYGRPARMGCDADGNPINPAHHWNEKSR
ncbi:HNH endonuclease [Diaphorobacter sp. DS2]|nr:HNH endonuclease [Diaphorobacter sp. DS2]